MSAIKRYNMYCSQLAMKHRPEWLNPLPDALPTKLAELRECQTLMEDVWITRTEGKIPRWLRDCDVRNGIRAMLKVDRCQEERERLIHEAVNLTKWLVEELAAIDHALCLPSSTSQFVIADQALMNNQTSISGRSSSTNEINYINNSWTGSPKIHLPRARPPPPKAPVINYLYQPTHFFKAITHAHPTHFPLALTCQRERGWMKKRMHHCRRRAQMKH